MPIVENPSVTTLDELLGLILRVEAAHPGADALTIARMLLRSKYSTPAWDWLLPTSAAVASVRAVGAVTPDDARTLAGDFTVALPSSERMDPSHVVAGIVAAAETLPPGGAYAEQFRRLFVTDLPPALTQLDIATWAGDIGSAAAEWASARPLPERGEASREGYLAYWSPDPDLIGDVDGVAMASTSPAHGFAFDAGAPLSENLRRFYHPSGAREGKGRSFHIFCALLGFPLEPDGVTLSAEAAARMDAQTKLLADWYAANNPDTRRWVLAHAPRPLSAGDTENGVVAREWARRAGDWRWFAGRFRDLAQRTLIVEGA